MNQYEPLQQIGKGAFGIIRKVKRISDGKVEGFRLTLKDFGKKGNRLQRNDRKGKASVGGRSQYFEGVEASKVTKR
jgi:hypothetical protein